ncbi:MAG: TrkH family potassium uptake protein [Spirochaetaceae bacterium]|nr:MAG: TrkH family potassium uptake protein [Spirochaetaceae bacterium]
MNVALILRIVSVLLFMIACFMLIPAGVAWYYGEHAALAGFLLPILGAFAAASLLFFLLRNADRQLRPRDGFILVGLAWVSAAALGALPFRLSGTIPRYVDAFFETMSGFTTTGATILIDIEALPYSMLFWRSLTHWLGGMGIIVLTVAVFPLLGVGGLQLMKAEAPGPSVDKITPKVTETAKILWLIYLGLTVLQTTLLLLGGLDLFEALTHTFGTLATGGFSPRAASVGHYSSAYVHVVITVFMILAGTNFFLYYKALTRQFSSVLRDTEWKSYLGVFATASLVIALILMRSGAYSGFGQSLRYAGFQAASILTTTGYATTDFALWPQAAQVVLFTLMFFGGCAGSTGGGIKIVRIVTLAKQAVHEMKYLLHPRGVFQITFGGQPVRKNVLYAISGFVFLYLILLLLTSLVVASGGFGIITSFTTALATLGNIGPGFGRIGPSENYAFFQDYIKWYLSFIMMTGRLEVFTILVIFTPAFWRN